MLRMEMLLAGHGDSLWIEYGDPQAPKRILIDGGARGTYQRALRGKLRQLSETERRFELLIVTHIDADHITGVLELLEDKETGFRAKDIWFNGFRHLPDENPATLGPVQGEKLTDLLLKPGIAWNGEFKGATVVVPTEGELPRMTLEDGFVLTLLSPTPATLAELKPEWEKEVRKAGLDPNSKRPEEVESSEGFQLLGGAPDVDILAMEPFSEDTSEANGSSIAVLAEFEGHRLLLTGDAHPGVLTAAINRLCDGKKLAVDACKLSHHGSKANVSRQLLETLDCHVYLFSTNGSHFKHPDPQAVARVITWGGAQPQLRFNYRTQFNDIWDAAPLRARHGYTTVFPASNTEGVVVEWQ